MFSYQYKCFKSDYELIAVKCIKFYLISGFYCALNFQNKKSKKRNKQSDLEEAKKNTKI